MRIELPESVKYIINKLSNAGYEAYAVGGCIRDSVMGIEPKDWDITTDAKPEEIKSIFKNTVDTGIKHGTVTVLYRSAAYEITTYRIDGVYSDGRHPDEVLYTDNLYEDLRRRDFRMNAMAYNDEKGFIDPFDGRADIEKREINCVGDAHERFSEDALRILRAFRFAAQLGFDIGKGTEAGALVLKNRLQLVSAERIREELNKIIMSGNPNVLYYIAKLGILGIAVPEMNIPEDSGNLQDYMEAIAYIGDSPAARWTVWLLGLINLKGSINVGSLLRKLKFDNKTIKMSCDIAKFVEYSEEDLRPENARFFLHAAGSPETVDAIMEVRKALAVKVYKSIERFELLSLIEKGYKQIYKNKDCLFIKDLAINGNDLMDIGYKQGTELGQILNILLNAVLINPKLNKKDKLLDYLKTRN